MSDMVYLVRTIDTGCPPVAVCFTRDHADMVRDALGAFTVESVPAHRALEEHARSVGRVNANGVGVR